MRSLARMHVWWPKIDMQIEECANACISCQENLRSLFSRLGIPSQIVSDNGPQFTSELYQQFCLNNGIRQTLTSPYHTRSNGEAERFVQTFKNAIRRGKNVGIQKALCQFLLKYRTTPHPITGETPSKLMFSREIKTRLYPSELEKPQIQKIAKAKIREFEPNDAVWVRNYSGQPKWIAGGVLLKQEPLATR